MAQLAERLLPTSKIRGSNPNIGNEIVLMNFCQLQFRKDENKEKEAEIGPFKKYLLCSLSMMREMQLAASLTSLQD